MGSPFSSTSTSNYNSNPPADDGSQVASNRVQWSTVKTKLSDPIKDAFDDSETATQAAFGKVVGGAGITTTAVDYTVTASDQGKFVKVTASGKTITTPDATVVDSPFVFSVTNESSGDITLDGSGSQTIDGAASITIPAGCGCTLNTDGSDWFTAGQNFNTTQVAPQGRLTLTSATPVMNSDVSSGTSVYYTPFVGNLVPISTNGTTFKMRQFSELTLTLDTNHVANTLYDVFIFDNSGTITIGTGPAWTSSTAGSSSRGSGAGSTQIARVQGLYVNAVAMTARNGSTTYSVGSQKGTYVGTFCTTSAGSTAMEFAPTAAGGGTNNRLYLWNMYNRHKVNALCRESASSWNYTSATIRPLDNSSANRISYVDGTAEAYVEASLIARVVTAAVNGAFMKIGLARNKTTGSFDSDSIVIAPSASGQNATATPIGAWTPSLGFNYIQAMEASDGTNTSTVIGGGTEAQLRVQIEM